MTSYVDLEHRPKDYLIGLGTALLAMLIILFGLMYKGPKKVSSAPAPVHTTSIKAPTQSKHQSLPPPPPPSVVQPPPPFVPPPKIKPPVSKKPQQQKVTHKKPAKPSHAPHKETKSSSSSDSSGTVGSGGETGGAEEGDHSAGANPVNGARPEYPADAQEENREGKVVASCDILTNGHTANCRIISSQGGHDFIESALEFLARARYQPAVINGEPVMEHDHRLTIDFMLGDD